MSPDLIPVTLRITFSKFGSFQSITWSVYAGVGLGVGVLVGFGVGVAVGSGVGVAVGSGVAVAVGSNVGSAVGFGVAAASDSTTASFVGVATGASVAVLLWQAAKPRVATIAKVQKGGFSYSFVPFQGICRDIWQNYTILSQKEQV